MKRGLEFIANRQNTITEENPVSYTHLDVYKRQGAYNLEKHNEIITIVDKSEYQKLMNFINREDPKAFVTIYNCLLYTSRCV